MDVAKVLVNLETQNRVELEETKKILMELVSRAKDSSITHGIMDYFYQTRSVRIVEILLRAPPQHIFDRLLEWLKSSTHKLSALSLLGHIIFKNPTWLYNIEKTAVFRELFKILKTERDVIPEMSALLCVIALLPKIPYLMKNYVEDLFEIFSYLAAWNNHQQSAAGGRPGTSTDHYEHLQIGLYIYFQRLYGMFPCNFVEYLKREYINPSNAAAAVKRPIFTHTIVPLLETVRMHPKLITETFESEKSELHWKKVYAYDVITQCSKLSVDSCDTHQSQAHHHDHQACAGHPYPPQVLEVTQINRYELKSVPAVCEATALPPVAQPSSSSNTTTTTTMDYFWSPSQMPLFPSPIPSLQSAPPSVTASSPANIQKPHGMSKAFVGTIGGTSPPEAAVEATPETTPMNDILRTQKSYPPQHSSAVRAIGLGGGGSQPSSPLKKTAFRYPPEQIDNALSKIMKLQMETTSLEQSLPYAPPPPTTSIPSSPLPIQPQLVASGSTVIVREDHYPMQQPQRIETDATKFELSQSPCNAGGLHMPNSRSIQEFKEISKQREREQGESSPEEQAAPQDVDPNKKTIAAQTEASWNSSAAYDHMLVELSKEGKSCAVEGKKAAITPKEILDKIIEAAISRKNAQNARNSEEYYKNHILLLSYQLNFERHQRELTAERNSRLYSSDRDIKTLDLNNKTLQNQVNQLLVEVDSLRGQLEQAHAKYSRDKSELVEELTLWKQKFQGDQDELKFLQGSLEQCQLRLVDEERQNRDKNCQLERLKGDLFDLQNERTELLHQADMGQHYHEQLINLQSELLLMGELHQHWQDRLCEVERTHQSNRQMDILHVAYEQEVDELHQSLQQKTSQLETVTSKLRDSDKRIVNAENLLLEQKRILKMTKEENEEKFKALEHKYETQKAIIIKMEEHLLELYKNPATCPPTELLRSEMVSSAEHASPLSLSLTSSDGLSTSLRSATEVKVGPTPSSSLGNVIAASISSHTLKAANSTENKSAPNSAGDNSSSMTSSSARSQT